MVYKVVNDVNKSTRWAAHRAQISAKADSGDFQSLIWIYLSKDTSLSLVTFSLRFDKCFPRYMRQTLGNCYVAILKNPLEIQ